MGKAPDPKRMWFTVHDARNRAFRPYVTAAGQASLQWNLLHETMGKLFVIVMGGGYINQHAAVWSAVTVDRSKREMLKAAAASHEGVVTGREYELEMQRAVTELCNAVEVLEIQRNNVVHGPLARVENPRHPKYGKVMPHTLLGNPRAMKLVGKDVLAEFRFCRDYARVLNQFAAEIDEAFHHGIGSFPEKPRPPRRGDRTKEKLRPQRTAATPRLPPRSSRA